mmetsp:Transcript_12635/g.21406  ORF Transcript_12635/g.21406 Transcript_12635/m.21406 type:complete len:297 (+) Transcript_12635:7-897(+)
MNNLSQPTHRCTQNHATMTKRKNEDGLSTSIAIIGASYAGLTLANTLQQNSSSITFTIFDSKTLPFTYVAGGDAFNVPSYSSLATRLALKTSRQANIGLTRKDVIESLIKRVTQHFIVGKRIEKIEERNNSFYLHTRQKLHSSDGASSAATASSNNNHKVYGPYQCVVGADGVRSKCRTSALNGTFLIGDARWVNDRWYDLGLRRIKRGADIAILDGLELGGLLLRAEETDNKDCHYSSQSFPLALRMKFCARQIQIARMTRILSTSIVFIAMVAIKNLSTLQSLLLSILDRKKIS